MNSRSSRLSWARRADRQATMARRVLLVAVTLAAAYGILLAGPALWARATPTHAACATSGGALQVGSSARVVSLCSNGVEEGSLRVALGRGGPDKRSEGDGRTPRGRYKLQLARHSTRYHLFLPV